MADVFISYSKSHLKLTRNLAEELEAKGLTGVKVASRSPASSRLSARRGDRLALNQLDRKPSEDS